MGLRVVEIPNPGAAISLPVCRTEVDMAKEFLNMDLIRHVGGWAAKGGFNIVLRTVHTEGQADLLIVDNHSATVTEIDLTQEVGEDDELPQEEIQPILTVGPATIPNRQFIAGDAMTMRIEGDGLKLILFGASIIARESTPKRYAAISESSDCSLTRANLPFKMGLVPVEQLANIRRVEFSPAP